MEKKISQSIKFCLIDAVKLYINFKSDISIGFKIFLFILIQNLMYIRIYKSGQLYVSDTKVILFHKEYWQTKS